MQSESHSWFAIVLSMDNFSFFIYCIDLMANLTQYLRATLTCVYAVLIQNHLRILWPFVLEVYRSKLTTSSSLSFQEPIGVCPCHDPLPITYHSTLWMITPYHAWQGQMRGREEPGGLTPLHVDNDYEERSCFNVKTGRSLGWYSDM